MHKKIILSLMTIAMLAGVGVQSIHAQEAFVYADGQMAQQKSKVSNREAIKRVKQSTKVIAADYYNWKNYLITKGVIPQVAGIDDERIENKINAIIQKDMSLMFLKQEDYAMRLYDDNVEKIKRKRLENTDFSSTVKEDILSLKVEHRINDQISRKVINCYTFDKKTGKQLLLQDLVSESDFKVIQSYSATVLAKEYSITLADHPIYVDYYITDESIQLIYDLPSEDNKRATVYQEVSIPLSKLKEDFHSSNKGLTNNLYGMYDSYQMHESYYFNGYSFTPVVYFDNEQVGKQSIPERINQYFINVRFDYLNNIKLKARAADVEAKKINYDIYPWFASVNTDVCYQSPDTLSGKIRYVRYVGGPTKVWVYDKGFTFDLNSGKLLTLKDLFSDSAHYEENLKKEIKKIKVLNPDQYRSFNVESIQDIQEFYLTDTDLVLISDPSIEVAYKDHLANTYNLPVLKIPLEKLDFQ